MNTISSTQNTVDLYEQRKVEAAKILEQIEKGKQNEQENNDSIEISPQPLQTFGSSTQNTNSSLLDGLVASRTITQDQADDVLSVFKALGMSIQASGTYSNKIKHLSPLDRLVASGTITQDQENSIKSTLHEAIKANGSSEGKSQKATTNILDKLVAKGTITQTQEDTIQSAFENSMNTKA